MTDMLEKVARDIAHFTVDCGGYSSRGDNPNLHSKECNALHQKIITRLDAIGESHVVAPREEHDRLKGALSIIIRNLEAGGDWVEAMKPISARFAGEMAELGRAAYFNEPHEKLDAALSASQETSDG